MALVADTALNLHSLTHSFELLVIRVISRSDLQFEGRLYMSKYDRLHRGQRSRGGVQDPPPLDPHLPACECHTYLQVCVAFTWQAHDILMNVWFFRDDAFLDVLCRTVIRRQRPTGHSLLGHFQVLTHHCHSVSRWTTHQEILAQSGRLYRQDYSPLLRYLRPVYSLVRHLCEHLYVYHHGNGS